MLNLKCVNVIYPNIYIYIYIIVRNCLEFLFGFSFAIGFPWCERNYIFLVWKESSLMKN
jgi:hypothetical protein